MKVILFLMSLFSGFTHASLDITSEEQVYEGLLINYPETEYVRTFIECSSGESSKIIKGVLWEHLFSIYNSAQLSEYGELYIRVQANVIEINKIKYPNSHFSRTMDILKVVSTGSSMDEIKFCRETAGIEQKKRRHQYNQRGKSRE